MSSKKYLPGPQSYRGFRERAPVGWEWGSMGEGVAQLKKYECPVFNQYKNLVLKSLRGNYSISDGHRHHFYSI